MKHLFLVIALFGTVPGLGSSLESIQEHKVCIPGTWSHLNEGRRLYEEGDNAAAAQVFSSLYQDHHNLFAIPFLKELRDHLTPELWGEIHVICPTPMSIEFKNNNLPLSMNIPDFPNEQKMLGMLFDRERIDKIQELILKNINQITYVNLREHWRNLDAHMGGGDSVFEILSKSTADSFYKEDLPFLFQAAKKGDIMYQYNLSLGFRLNLGILRSDFKNAYFWNKKAADQCDEDMIKAQTRLGQFRSGGVTPGTIYYNLARIYLHNKDIDQAIDYFEKSVELGFDPAKEILLNLLPDSPKHIEKYKEFLKKLGGDDNLCKLAILQTRSPRDFDTGITSLECFANKGVLPAQFELEIFINPKRVLQSETKKQKTKRMSKTKSVVESAYKNIDKLDLKQKVRLVELLLVDPEFSQKKLILDKFDIFLETLNKAERLEMNDFQYALGTMLAFKGEFEQVAHYYRSYLNTDKEYKTDVLNELGYFYMYGKGVETDYQKATDLFDQAIEKGNLFAMYNRALMYHKGWGGKDLNKAVELYQRPAEQGDVDAWYHLGLAYIGLNDDKKAHFWSKKAADQGHLIARHNRIYLFLTGHKDVDQTLGIIKEELFQNARDGSPESQIALAFMFASGSRELEIEKSPQKAREILEELLNNMHDLHPRDRFSAKILLDRLEDEDIDEEEVEQEQQNVDMMPVPIEELSAKTETLKITRESLRERKSTRNIERALKRKQKIRELRERQRAEKSRNIATPEHDFTDEELDILAEFASHKGAMKEREFTLILKLLGAKPTKSGYVIKQGAYTVGGHRPHANDGVVAKGAIKGVQSYLKEGAFIK